MLKYNGICDITIECEAGVYALVPESAAGKTLLYNMLAIMSPYDVLLATCRRKFTVDLRPDTLQDVKLAFFDRVDSYEGNTEFLEMVNGLSKDSIVLLDYKGQDLMLNRRIGTAEFDSVSPKRIEVYG